MPLARSGSGFSIVDGWSRQLNVIMFVLFFVIGLSCLGVLFTLLLKS